MIQIFNSKNQDDKFYAMMGRNFASREIAKELEYPVYNQKDTTWYLFTKLNVPVGFVSVCEHRDYYYIDNLYVHMRCIACNPYSIMIFKRHGFKEIGKNGKWNKYIKH